MTSRNDGFVMATVLLLLLVLTLIGLAAMNSSTVENMLSGNIRLRERNMSNADGAVAITVPAIETVVRQETAGAFTFISNASTLATELRTSEFDPDNVDSSPDFTLTVGTETVDVDVDKMYTKFAGGQSIEFASGYEGVGKGAGSGSYTYYRINATSRGAVGSEATVGTIYRYVPK